ncbi:PstS family phosphate ABC transporter substrate-binding protein [Candidatus Synechococcus calcipolaris G9]|uniref:Phosphate-binding protein n=1 Tax=Candidatus Synechococcus calcipolaris G9 TaxID=1497997 RepID=A0ABT6EYH0_9SYNE|nr:PstS family phosphate ABC transporter substrate-binding protein [Candidatus Synechococcus calcipolaris]MDG2990782.1 PstS family phosphate ABC transporter substrate-binding protein [Candidatus Synechococcus calcipolaris G9]
MMFNNFVDRWIKAGVLTLTLALVGCGGTNDSSESSMDPSLKTIAIDGSSTVYPISKAMAAAFTATKEGENADISVKFSGTSAGFREFCTGKTDISDASRPILIAELNQCIQNGVPFIEIPIAFDALTIAVNPENTWLKELSVQELATLWQKASEQKLTRWNQLRPDFPDTPVILWGPGGDSGTFDYFNEAILGDSRGARADYTGSEDDDEIVAGIAANANALGYLPFAYFEANTSKLRAIPINNGQGAIAPGLETVQSSEYQPLSRPLFLYVNAQKAQEKPLLRQFLEFYLETAPEIVTQVGYVPLTEEGYQLANLQFIRGEVGTAFKGVPEPDVTIEELLRRQVIFQDSQASAPGQ